MINSEELALCRQRGHETQGLTPRSGWMQCGKCGMWVRTVSNMEEREDAPPTAERDLLGKSRATTPELAALKAINTEELAPGEGLR